ncbi:MAG: SAM-dependent methyltransferase [Lachnospiraceae bacterium]|nr:SAM-dependent methyltransferase [Lachnospiraceae bacterium]
MIQLSQRLQAVADLAEDAGVVADVGTDHGYIPLFLIACGKAQRAIAMDINEGPLQRAREHIRQYNQQERIETRLSDGLSKLRPGEAQTIVIAGMGGALMKRILTEGEATAHAADCLVLQPQSELPMFRRFLVEYGYRILREDMVYEDGKFYSMMAVKWTESDVGDNLQAMTEADFKYGPLLRARKHPVLRKYLLRQKEQKQKILERLGKNARQDVSERRAQIREELEEIEVLLKS